MSARSLNKNIVLEELALKKEKEAEIKRHKQEEQVSQQPEQAKGQGNARGGQAVSSARGGNGGGQKAYRGGSSHSGRQEYDRNHKPPYTAADRAKGFINWRWINGGWQRALVPTYDSTYKRYIKDGLAPEEAAKYAKKLCRETLQKERPDLFKVDGE